MLVPQFATGGSRLRGPRQGRWHCPRLTCGVHGARSVTVAGAEPRTGQETVFARPVLSAPAFVKRDGSVLADAWLPDLVRLGALEAHLGDGVIEKIVEKGLRNGLLPLRERRRLLSYPLVIRLVIAMTLLPASSYSEAMRTVAGLLADVPFTLGWHVPTGKSIGEWRLLIPPEVMQEVFWHAAGDLVGDGEPSAVTVAGMPVDAVDGMLVNVADTKENRDYFGTTGTGDGSSPFPQMRIVALTARAGRVIRGAVLGTARDGEQTLLKTLAAEQRGLFAGRLVLFDRNFPGHDAILSVLLAGGHVIARVRGGIALPFQGRPGPGLAARRIPRQLAERPSGKKEDRLPVRVAEHSALVTGPGGEQVSETCTLVTTLLDKRAVPAGALRDAYPNRWTASETTFGEDKATITGPGERTSGPPSAPAARRSSSGKPGPGWRQPSWCARARPPPCAARRPPPAPCAARTRNGSPPTRNPSPPPGATPSAPWKPPRSPPRRPSRASPPQRSRPPARTCTPSTSPAATATRPGSRSTARSSRTRPRPSRPSPGNTRSSSTRPATAEPAAPSLRPARRAPVPPARGTARPPAATRGLQP